MSRTRLSRQLLQVESLEDRLTPTTQTINVSTLADSGNGTLRAAIIQADLDTNDNIVFSVGLLGGTIQLGNSLPSITAPMTITGLGASGLTISGNEIATVFAIPADVDVTITDLTIKEGLTSGDGGGIDNGHGSLTLKRVSITDCQAANGAALFSSGSTTISQSSFSGNTGANAIFLAGSTGTTNSITQSSVNNNSGGGIVIDNQGVITTHILNSEFNGNGGFGVFTEGVSGGTVSVTDDSEINGNTGGGIVMSSGGPTNMSFENSVIENNSSSTEGGAVTVLSGTFSMGGATVKGNTAPLGGAIYASGAGVNVIIIGTNFVNNTSTNNDGVISINNAAATTVILDTSVISGGTGSGIKVLGAGGGAVNLQGDTIRGNEAGTPGGGIDIVSGPTNVSVVDSTIFANTATGGGGGINHAGTGTLSILDSTINGNVATAAGGGISVATGSPFIMANSVVALNISPTSSVDISGKITNAAASGSNFIGTTTGFNAAGSKIAGTGNPMLGPIGMNGGLTPTELPVVGSPLINAGSNALVPLDPPDDQRGGTRIVGPAVDIGSTEFQQIQPLLQPLLVASGAENGTAQTYTFNAAGVPVAQGTPFTPFPGFTGSVLSATGDVNGDGSADTIYVTGPGTPIRVEVISGADGSMLVAPFDPFGGNFTGGGFLTAADIDKDGRSEFIVSPDQGGGPRVSIFSLNPDSSVATRANFFGIDDPNFRGGARVAAGDINADGVPDLAVAAGFAGGPRVALFDGTTVFTTQTKLINDFFAFADTLRNGVYVAIGDVNGDGFGDVIIGAGPGGGPVLKTYDGQKILASGANDSNLLSNFFVGGSDSDRSGVRVAVVNADGDARADIAVGTGADVPDRVRVYLGKDFSGPGEPTAFQDVTPFGTGALADGVFVG